MLVKFKIRRNLRFLSHAEMMTVFERAVVRSRINIKYSQGFNPHPKLSLPLPRPVGVESEEELLCIKIASGLSDFDPAGFRESLLDQLPDSIEIVEVTASIGQKPPQPQLVTYIFAVKPDFSLEKLKKRIEELKTSQILNVQRDYGETAAAKILNVRDFLKNISIDGRMITAQCIVTPAGSIRVGEILQLLDLDEEKLAAPVCRKNVQWQFS